MTQRVASGLFTTWRGHRHADREPLGEWIQAVSSLRVHLALPVGEPPVPESRLRPLLVHENLLEVCGPAVHSMPERRAKPFNN